MYRYGSASISKADPLRLTAAAAILSIVEGLLLLTLAIWYGILLPRRQRRRLRKRSEEVQQTLAQCGLLKAYYHPDQPAHPHAWTVPEPPITKSTLAPASGLAAPPAVLPLPLPPPPPPPPLDMTTAVPPASAMTTAVAPASGMAVVSAVPLRISALAGHRTPPNLPLPQSPSGDLAPSSLHGGLPDIDTAGTARGLYDPPEVISTARAWADDLSAPSDLAAAGVGMSMSRGGPARPAPLASVGAAALAAGPTTSPEAEHQPAFTAPSPMTKYLGVQHPDAGGGGGGGGGGEGEPVLVAPGAKQDALDRKREITEAFRATRSWRRRLCALLALVLGLLVLISGIVEAAIPSRGLPFGMVVQVLALAMVLFLRWWTLRIPRARCASEEAAGGKPKRRRVMSRIGWNLAVVVTAAAVALTMMAWVSHVSTRQANTEINELYQDPQMQQTLLASDVPTATDASSVALPTPSSTLSVSPVAAAAAARSTTDASQNVEDLAATEEGTDNSESGQHQHQHQHHTARFRRSLPADTPSDAMRRSGGYRGGPAV